MLFKPKFDFQGTFLEMVGNIKEAAQLFSMTRKIENPEQFAKRLKEMEDTGDYHTHRVIVSLNQGKKTPYAQDDILKLAVLLDDIMDGFEACASRFDIFKIGEMDDFMHQMSMVNYRCSMELYQAFEYFSRNDLKGMRDNTVKINQLENEGDVLLRSALKTMFERESDANHNMKYKEIYEILESISDQFEDVSDQLEGIIMKYA